MTIRIRKGIKEAATLNWKKATLAQLYEIAYNDSGAPLMHKHAALTEIQRRQPQRREKVNYKMKKVYPR